MLDLKKLMIDTKSVWVDYPGSDTFSVEVTNLSRQELTRLRKRCVTSKFNRSTRQPVETLDEEKFVTEFTRATIKNWKGLTLELLETLVLLDIGDLPLSTEVEYTEEIAVQIVSASTEFDTWLNEVVWDLDNFRSPRKGRSL